MEIYTRFQRPQAEPTASGTEEEYTYEMTIDKNGHKEIRRSGKTNVYEKIQASYEETKIENIIARAMGGETSGLMAHQGQYLDITNAPQTLAEAQQAIQTAKNIFEKLPISVKEQYNMSVEQYIADIGSDNWMAAMGIEKPKQVVAETPTEGKEEETNES